MSYRTVKRVLGETSLERKCLLLFGLCLLLLISGSFWWYGNKTDELVYDSNRRAGKLLVGTALTGIHLEEFETRDEHKPAVAALVDQLRTQAFQWRTIRPEGQPGPQDPFERQLLAKWKQAGLETTDSQQLSNLFAQRRLNEPSSAPKPPAADPARDLRSGGYEYQYYQPIYVKHECVLCHRVMSGNLALREGDLLAIVQVSLRDDETIAAQHENRAILITTAILTVFLAIVAMWTIVRYVIVKPLKHLRGVSDEISRGRLDQRADIHTGDEFEALGEAFNRMLRHLVNVQQELQNVNRDLDAKVDELAQANMRLFEMNRLKSDFLATVSHELRTPLNSIIGFSDVLDSIESLDERQRRYVQNIRRSGRMLLEMINDILDLAKVESGKMEVRPSEFRIERLISAQCDMARPLTERKNIDLEWHAPPHLPPLYQDHAKVQQILNNLLSNAIKFTPEGGRVSVYAKRDDQGQLRLTVADTGLGIAKEDQQVIFEKFRQGNSALPEGDAMTREYSGTGLGLSIVKELCRLLGGEIDLESALGSGSTFTVILPWTLPQPESADAEYRHQLDELTRDPAVQQRIASRSAAV